MGQRSNTLLLFIAVAANLQSANTHQSSTSQDAAVSSFSCVEKVIGGYYADISLGCTMFHVCTLGEKGEIRDIIFKCVPGTLFSQEKRVCEREDEVNCAISEQFYHLNNDLYGPGIIPETATIVDTGSEHSPSIRTENIAHIVSTQQPPVQFAPTSFTCADKIHGGLYADVETGCSVFHICSVEPDGSYRSSRFVCGTGTLFDQTSRTCSAEAAVDCARSPSLYYLNEPFQTPDGEVDLCRTRPVGTPLADITTSCQEYTVCEVSQGQILERRYPCKKGQLFSQLHRKCLSAKKVKCAKETLNEILGLGAMRDTAGHVLNRRKRGPTSLMHSYRFRRAALPPLTNLVLSPGVQDARVRRALFNLAALEQWVRDNAHRTSFIEVYTLHTRGKNNYFPKKINPGRSYVPHSENNNYNTYSYVQRKKRQALLDDAHLIGKSDIVSQSVTSTGISPAKAQSHKAQTISDDAPLIGKSDVGSQSVTSTGISPAKVQLPKIETFTVGKSSLSSSVVDASVATTTTATTTTRLTVPTSTSAKLEEPTAPIIIDPATKIISSTKVTQPILTITVSNTGEKQVTKTATSSNLPTTTTLTSNVSVSSIAPNSVTKPMSITSTVNNSTSITPALEISSTTSKPTTTIKTVPVDTKLSEAPLTNETQSLHQTSKDPSNAESSIIKNETIVENPVLGTSNTTAGEENSINTTVKENNIPTSTMASSTAVIVETLNTTVRSVPNISEESPNTTVASINKSSEVVSPVPTEAPTTVTQQPTSSSTTVTLPPSTESVPVTAPSGATIVTPTPATPILTRETLPETNFTCKDKTLEKFYPDVEVNCQVFHYCSPGFTQEQVLDIKFLCTNDTMFDVVTQKCESKEQVRCETEEGPIHTTASTSPPMSPHTPTPTPLTPQPTTKPTPKPTTEPTPKPTTKPPPTTTTTITTTPEPITPSSTTTTTTTETTTSTTTLPTTSTSIISTLTEASATPATVSETTQTSNTTLADASPVKNASTQTSTQKSLIEEPLTSPASSETDQVNTTIQDLPVSRKTESPLSVTDTPKTSVISETNETESFTNNPLASENINQTKTQSKEVITNNTEINKELSTESDIKTSRENVVIEELVTSTTTVEPTDEDIVTELGPLSRSEVSIQKNESPSPSVNDSKNTEAEALTSVSSTESISRSTSSETSNSSSVSNSHTQQTQSAR